jgi:hypothetical protein
MLTKNRSYFKKKTIVEDGPWRELADAWVGSQHVSEVLGHLQRGDAF